MSELKGLIFDLDGTLVDNMMVHHRAWQRTLKELGLDYSLEQVKEEIHGVNMEILQRLFGDRFTPQERQQIADGKEKNYRQIFADQLKPVAGVEAFLKRARELDIPMAVATAGPPENAFFVLDGLDFRRYFTAVIHSQSVRQGKPDPEVIEKAAAEMGVALEDCLYFEDSVTGAETGLNGGCPVFVITTTHDEEEFAHVAGIIGFKPDFNKLWINDAREFTLEE